MSLPQKKANHGILNNAKVQPADKYSDVENTIRRKTVSDNYTGFSVKAEIFSAMCLLFCGYVPCTLLGIAFGVTIRGIKVGTIYYYIVWNACFQLGCSRIINFILKIDAFCYLYMFFFFYNFIKDILLGLVLYMKFIFFSVLSSSSWILAAYLCRYFFGKADLYKLHIFLLWQLVLVGLFGIMVELLKSGHYLYISWLVLISEMLCRIIFMRGFTDTIHLEVLQFYCITQTVMYEAIRFNCYCRMVAESNISSIVVNIIQNIAISMFTHAELTSKLKKKLGLKVT